MAKAANPIPKGFHTLTPHITVKNATGYMDFLVRAFGAVELGRMPGPDGRVMHAEVRVGDSIMMFNDDFPEHCGGQPLAEGRQPFALHMYVPDADAAFARATAAGCTVVMPLGDQFWGDRYGVVDDPFGVRWGIATRKEELTSQEIQQRQKAAFGG